MTLDASGNLGIGPSSPTTKLTISGTSAIITTDGTTSTGARGLDFVHSGQSYGSLLNYAQTGETALTAGYTGSSGYFLTFKTENTERARITNGGDLLVGTTSAGGTGTFRGVTICGGLTGSLGASYDYVGALYKYDSVNENGLGFWNTRGGASPAGGPVLKFYVGTSLTNVGSITTGSASTSYNTSSDYRLKENVVGVTGASARVQQLNPVRFNFIADLNKTVDGFLAHEVQNVVPEAITGTKDEVETYTDDEGNEQTRPVYQGIDQSKLVPLLTAALQEALAKIESLEARLDAANI
jgi:hypothetical protein